MKKLLALLALLITANSASAALISALGSVSALTSPGQITQTILGTADFEAQPGTLPAGFYSGQGLTFLNGSFSNGIATLPFITDVSPFFPTGGTSGLGAYYAGVAVFDSGLSVTQFGLNAGRNGNQYLTAWDTGGQIIGQVNWSPTNDSGFVGLDSNGVSIGMIAYGNDDLWNGQLYGVGGSTIMSDNWVWAGVSPVPVPAAVWLFGSALIGLIGFGKRTASSTV